MELEHARRWCPQLTSFLRFLRSFACLAAYTIRQAFCRLHLKAQIVQYIYCFAEILFPNKFEGKTLLNLFSRLPSVHKRICILWAYNRL